MANSLLDGLDAIFADTLGEPVLYRAPSASADTEINGIWYEMPVLAGGYITKTDAVRVEVHVRAADVPGLIEGATFERKATGARGKAVPPFRADNGGMIAVTLERIAT